MMILWLGTKDISSVPIQDNYDDDDDKDDKDDDDDDDGEDDEDGDDCATHRHCLMIEIKIFHSFHFNSFSNAGCCAEAGPWDGREIRGQ